MTLCLTGNFLNAGSTAPGNPFVLEARPIKAYRFLVMWRGSQSSSAGGILASMAVVLLGHIVLLQLTSHASLLSQAGILTSGGQLVSVYLSIRVKLIIVILV